MRPEVDYQGSDDHTHTHEHVSHYVQISASHVDVPSLLFQGAIIILDAIVRMRMRAAM